MADAKEVTWVQSLASSTQDIILLFISFSISFNLRHLMKLLPHGPSYGIIGSPDFNPESNYFLLLGMVAATLVIFWALKRLLSYSRLLFRAAIISVLVVSLFVGVIAPGVSRYQGNIDTFHNGEELAPGLAHLQGKKLYTDIYTLRGAGEDVVMPWLSFKIFGTRIGSYYLFGAILQLLSAAAFFILLHRLFRKDLEFLVVSVWFSLSAYGAFYTARDVFTWIFLILITATLTRLRPNKIWYILLGFIAGAALFYSFDRGLFLSLFLFIICIFTLLFERQKNIFQFRASIQRQKIITVACIVAGYLIALAGALAVLGFSGFGSFIANTLKISRYQGIIFNYPYSEFHSNTVFDWLPVLVMTVCAIVVFNSLQKHKLRLPGGLVLGMLLLAYGIISFRAATGRPDSGHIAYGSPALFLAFFFIMFNQLRSWGDRLGHVRFSEISQSLPLYFAAGFLLLPATLNYFKLAEMNQVSLQPAKTVIKAPSKDDSYWYTANVSQITNFIKNNSKPSDYLFDFSSDPAFYYTTGLRNPTRLYISWFADPSPLEDEMLTDLQHNPPALVLYRSGTYYDRPEFVSMDVRLPKISKWLSDNYQTRQPIGNTGAIVLFKN